MKRTDFVFVLLLCTPIFAQDDPSEKRIEELKSKINRSKKGEKLKWMDSLSNFIAHDTAFASDSIVKKNSCLCVGA